MHSVMKVVSQTIHHFLFSLCFSQRKVSAIDVWLSNGLSEVKVKHELRNCNPRCKKYEKNISEAESLVIDEDLSLPLESGW